MEKSIQDIISLTSGIKMYDVKKDSLIDIKEVVHEKVSVLQFDDVEIEFDINAKYLKFNPSKFESTNDKIDIPIKIKKEISRLAQLMT